MTRQADWKGPVELRFRFRTFRKEWGRYCYRTNAFGQATHMWWEWETNTKGRDGQDGIARGPGAVAGK